MTSPGGVRDDDNLASNDLLIPGCDVGPGPAVMSRRRLVLVGPASVRLGAEAAVVLQAEGAPGGLAGTLQLLNEKDTRLPCSAELPFALGPGAHSVQRLVL
ncbi:hypothetical protein Y1Q_0014866 [Alligator mississippiensis]|uniref:Uncharacterized protein n=1 Tax=Alligator mississippiensis TaxID=8496 RepID=A0A151N3E9_ALLMI|nr:hypothetical protein Y1Q_0014866 [Alligator mississippiensis]